MRPASSDRKSTRLNSSHRCISYAGFCLKKKGGRTRGSYSRRGRALRIPHHRRRVCCLHRGTGKNLCFFFFNETAPPEIYTLSLHDALPISITWEVTWAGGGAAGAFPGLATTSAVPMPDRKSTRLNSSHRCISYAAFCL